MIETVQMYRVVCDNEGCGASPQDGGDYWAWVDPGSALDDATNSDWYVGDGDNHLCRLHAPRCSAPGCDIALVDAEFGAFCEDHAPEDQP